MKIIKTHKTALLAGVIFLLTAAMPLCAAPFESEEGFVPLFNGKDLSGWVGSLKNHTVKNGVLIHKSGENGNLYTKKRYDNFAFRFEFKLTPGANNGIGIRTPRQGDPAYAGFEIQVLDNSAEKYAHLKPYQYHGSIYSIAPAKRGHLKPVGEWNSEEIIADGNFITVILNEATIVDHFDVSACKRPCKGHIAFLGHGSRVDFRNIRIKELSSTRNHVPPPGFTSLFDGKTLNGWKGLMRRPYNKPHARKNLSLAATGKLQRDADERMSRHWAVEDGMITFDGKGSSLCTKKKYGDFEMYISWKIEKGGDSGIYIRGLPQVQIWDKPEGSGALWNNKKIGNKPLVAADNPTGEWNTFFIKMVGDKVSVHLNGRLVVNNAPLENLWQPGKPIPERDQIELQSHNSRLWFKNIYIRDL